MAQDAQHTGLLPAYAAIGDDSLKRDAVARRLKARLQKMGDMTFNYDELNAENATGGDVVAACNTLPFASPVRMVRVKNVDKMKKQDSEQLVAYLGNPNDTTVLLIEAEKLASNTRLRKAISALGKDAVIDCATPKKAQLPRLVRSMAVSHGITLTEGAARLLVELVGEDTVHIDTELKKLALSHSGTDAVNEHEVSQLVTRTKEVKPWELVDALAARNLGRCLMLLGRIESSSPHALMAMCVGRIRELVCAKALYARGEQHALANVLKKQDWQVRNHVEWSRRYTREELRRALVLSRDAERAMKSGSDPDEVFLSWLISVVGRS